MDLKEKILNGVNKLPTLPTVYSTLSEAIEDPRASSEKVAKVLAADQVSAFKILKVANSPFFGFRGKIDTITQAIMYLGFTEVRNIVFALTVIDFFSKDKVLANFKPVDFWAHSIGVGIATRMIGSAIGEKSVENYFLGGVIHDIGKLLFLEVARDEYSTVLDMVETENISIRIAEKKILGFDHSYAGMLLAEKWQLPKNLQNVISAHHEGKTGDITDRLVASVHVADIMVRMLDLGFAGDKLVHEPDKRVWDILKLPEGYFTSCRKRLIDDFDRTIHIMLV